MGVFNVTSTADSGAGSLRQAIFDANISTGADTINFDSSLSGGTISLSSGELLISDALTINGLGANLLTVDAQNLGFRVFNINDQTSNLIDVLINGLTITGGQANEGGFFNNVGGGINNSENLIVTDSTVSGNTAGFDGGGIYNNGTARLTNSTVSGNTAGSGGGGIANGGLLYYSNVTLIVTNSTVSGNTAGSGGGGIANGGRHPYYGNNGTLIVTNSTLSGNTAGSGGGIVNNNGTATVTNSTVSGNEAGNGGGIDNNDTLIVTNSTLSGNTAGRGGGIDNTDTEIDNTGTAIGNTGTAIVTNSTLSGNTAVFFGGGIYNYNGTVTVTNSTLSGNTAGFDGGGIANGFHPYYSNGTANLTNTIIANSTGGDCYNINTIATNLNNLIEDGSCSPALSGDPNLSPLQNNGGPTLTHALLPGSIAIDAGSNAGASGLPFDQRGSGFDRIVNETVDLGAFEVQSQSPVTVPEPSSIIGILALGALGLSRWRKGKGHSSKQ